MQNLTACGVVEMSEAEMLDVEGGLPFLVIGAIAVAIVLLTPSPAY